MQGVVDIGPTTRSRSRLPPTPAVVAAGDSDIDLTSSNDLPLGLITPESADDDSNSGHRLRSTTFHTLIISHVMMSGSFSPQITLLTS